jgi:hypothetical protein
MTAAIRKIILMTFPLCLFPRPSAAGEKESTGILPQSLRLRLQEINIPHQSRADCAAISPDRVDEFRAGSAGTGE